MRKFISPNDNNITWTGAISFDTTAGKQAVLSYLIVSSSIVLINYVGDFGSYPQ